MKHSPQEIFSCYVCIRIFFHRHIFKLSKLQKSGINIPAKYDRVAQTTDRNNVNT